MLTITIPKNLTKGEELVVIPRKEYERFLRAAKKPRRRTQLDRELDQIIQEVRRGAFLGPFKSATVGLRALKGTK